MRPDSPVTLVRTGETPWNKPCRGSSASCHPQARSTSGSCGSRMSPSASWTNRYSTRPSVSVPPPSCTPPTGPGSRPRMSPFMRLLGSYLSLRPEEVHFGRDTCPCCGGPHGRPTVLDADDRLFFSLSHRGDLAVVGTAAAPIGVDVELVPDEDGTADLAAMLHVDEQAELAALSPAGPAPGPGPAVDPEGGLPQGPRYRSGPRPLARLRRLGTPRGPVPAVRLDPARRTGGPGLRGGGGGTGRADRGRPARPQARRTRPRTAHLRRPPEGENPALTARRVRRVHRCGDHPAAGTHHPAAPAAAADHRNVLANIPTDFWN